MITCTEAVHRLWEYLENELEPGTRGRLEEHLAFCRRCCGELEFARELKAFLASAARPDLPDDVEGRLESFLEGLDDVDLDDLDGLDELDDVEREGT